MSTENLADMEIRPIIGKGSQADYRYREGNNRLGLWLFIISDSFVFAGLLISRYYLLGFNYHPDVNQILGLAVTVMLVVSSYFMFRAETLMKYGDVHGFTRNALVTMVLGALFLIGVVGLEWQLAPAGPNDGAVWSLFYTMTGFHAFHVFTGLILLFIVWRKARLGKYSVDRHWGVEAAAVYWHFVDVVWFFFYPALYLVGRAIT